MPRSVRRNLGDAELFSAYLAGDVSAFSALWHRHAQALRRFLRLQFGARVASDDFLQEAFLSLVQNAGRIRDPSTLRHYLLTAVRRLAFLERRRVTQREVEWSEVPGDLAAVLPVNHEAREVLSQLSSALERLSTRRRAVFVLICVEQHSAREACAKLGISPATLRRELRAARRYVLRWMVRDRPVAD